MASAGIELLSMGSEVNEHLLAKLADKLYADRLEEFGTKIIRLGHAECRNIIHDAGGVSWAQCNAVSYICCEINSK